VSNAIRPGLRRDVSSRGAGRSRYFCTNRRLLDDDRARPAAEAPTCGYGGSTPGKPSTLVAVMMRIVDVLRARAAGRRPSDLILAHRLI